jgi:ribonucleoside-triphosphate reductase
MTGQKYSDVRNNWEFKDLLTDLSLEVDDAAIQYAHSLRIPVPVKKRTVAPTGTISKMPGVSEGIHPIFSRYFIRRIRFSVEDERQAQMLRDYWDQGYLVEPDLYADNANVVSIATKDTLVEATAKIWGESEAERLVESADELTLHELLTMQYVYQTYWADNAVSFTANVDPDRYTPEEVRTELLHFGGHLKGTTIFPEASMPQAPYERITKEEFDAAFAKAVADGVDENCANGSCPIR